MTKLLSIDLKADFGVLKKPDTNEPVYLTFNMLHKPALLGILGAIAGYSGFKKQGEMPEYLMRLKDVKIGIAPLETTDKIFHEEGNFSKTIIKYNNSTGMASDEEGGNLIITEQTLVAPAYRCYILLDRSNSDHEVLYQYLIRYRAEYLPYLGKNECSVWWDNTTEYDFESFETDRSFKIHSLFIKDQSLKGNIQWFTLDTSELTQDAYMYFENLPVGYLGKPIYQYEYKSFAFTNFTLKKQYRFPEEYPLLKLDDERIIQVF